MMQCAMCPSQFLMIIRLRIHSCTIITFPICSFKMLKHFIRLLDAFFLIMKHPLHFLTSTEWQEQLFSKQRFDPMMQFNRSAPFPPQSLHTQKKNWELNIFVLSLFDQKKLNKDIQHMDQKSIVDSINKLCYFCRTERWKNNTGQLFQNKRSHIFTAAVTLFGRIH